MASFELNDILKALFPTTVSHILRSLRLRPQQMNFGGIQVNPLQTLNLGLWSEFLFLVVPLFLLVILMILHKSFSFYWRTSATQTLELPASWFSQVVSLVSLILWTTTSSSYTNQLSFCAVLFVCLVGWFLAMSSQKVLLNTTQEFWMGCLLLFRTLLSLWHTLVYLVLKWG